MIKDGTVVSLSYSLKDASGQELDRADKNSPFSYLHGAGQIVPGLENELTGLNVGDTKQVTIKPEEGYGEVNPALRMAVDKSAFPQGQQLEEGMRFAAEVNDGQKIQFMITGFEGEQVNVDGNHPLAGETLHFDVEVINIREATKEEKEHGHAHGADGSEGH